MHPNRDIFQKGLIHRFFNFLNRIFWGPLLREFFVRFGIVKKYKFLNTNPSAIGHLCLDVDVFIKEARIRKFDFIGVLLANKRIVANEVVSRIWANDQHIIVINNPLLCYLFDYLRIYGDTGFDCSNYCAKFDFPARAHEIYRSYAPKTPVPTWPADLYAEGKSLFEKVFPGVDARSLIVLHCRDSIYDLKNRNANYFSSQHRNSDMSSYSEILDFLHKRGFYVIRIGEYEPFKSPYDALIHKIPPLPKFELDLINAYITSQCVLFLGCDSGALMMPTIWDRPIFLLNFLPYDCLRQFASKCMSVPKLLLKNGKILTAEEIFKHGYHRFNHDAQYQLNDIEIIMNHANDCMEDFRNFFQAFVEGDKKLQIQLRESSEQKNYANLSPQDCFDKYAAGLIPSNFFRKHKII